MVKTASEVLCKCALSIRNISVKGINIVVVEFIGLSISNWRLEFLSEILFFVYCYRYVKYEPKATNYYKIVDLNTYVPNK